MNRPAKSLAVFVLLFAAIGAAGWWFLNDGTAPQIEKARAESSRSSRAEAPLAATAEPAEAARTAAERSAEKPQDDAAPAEVAADVPTADHLSGIVVDRNGRPIVGAKVSFGPVEGAFFGRRRGRGVRLSSLSPGDGGATLTAVETRSGTDGAFLLKNVARVESLVLRVDHPDFVVYTRNDLIVPSSGMELGRIVLEPGATVTGQVFGPGGAKLAGAEVSLRDAPDDESPMKFLQLAFGPRGVRTAVSDEAGRFRLTGMPPGRAEVVATSEGLCEAVSPTVELLAMQEFGGIVLHLERGDTIRGVVRDSAGKAVAGANVNANSADGFRRLNLLALGQQGAVTDVEGRFSLAGLTRGVYEVGVDATGYAPRSLAGIDSAVSAPLEITLGASAHVAGTVRLRGSSERVKRVEVQLVPWFGDDNAIPGFEIPDAKNAATDDGAFLVADVDPGQYRIAARGAGTTRAYSSPITVEEGTSVDGVEIEVERGALLSGRVVDGATGAPVAGADVTCFTAGDDEPAPLAVPGMHNVHISTRIGRGGPFSFSPDRQSVGRAKSDSEGHFEIGNLGAGRFVLDVSHPEFATARSDEFAVAAAENRQGADVRLGRGGTVEGNVVGIDGNSRAGDRIDVESKSVAGVSRSAVSDADGWYRIEHVPAGEAIANRTESDDEGSGAAMIFRAVVVGGDAEKESGKRIVVEEGQTLRVDFSQVEKPYVEGVVTCSEGVVAGALVSAMPDGNGGLPFFFGAQKEVSTGTDGGFRLTDLDPGSWRVSVRHPQGLVPTTATVTLASGSPVRQDFFLEGGVVEGDVVAQKDHAQVQGATVTLERVQEGDDSASAIRGDVSFVFATGGPAGRRGGMARSIRFGGDAGTRVTTDRAGHFRVPWVPAGKYRVSANHDGFLGSQSDVIELPANGRVDGVTVALPPAAKLRVKLLSKSSGEALSSCRVQLESEDGNSHFGFTDAEGIATFESLQPGTWTATGKRSWNDAEGSSRSVTCAAEKTAEITIDL